MRRGVRIAADCGVCPEVEESIYHVLVECLRAVRIWRCAGISYDPGQRWSSIAEFICFLETPGAGPGMDERGTRIAYLAYHSWLDRNVRVFEGRSSPPEVVVAGAFLHAEEFLSTAVRSPSGLARDIWGTPSALVAPSYVFVSWVPLPPSFLKVNFDGSMAADGRGGGVGFVIRDHDARLVALGGQRIFDASVVCAELRAAWEGISYARWTLGAD
ncbi:uncharacterized protein LOC120112086 [Phoenix dactylifera]|uniref:Uncharacterized protein LOC120112086 n=1 Tax=Phoenix dactylifera TaxID=42345 RepID=A0A8B9AJR5_PHODC|nr:uncharacterized protein LOC120112086 [Phoenix dactylifera]